MSFSLKKASLIVVFFACMFAQHVEIDEVSASLILPNTDTMVLDFRTSSSTVSPNTFAASDSPTRSVVFANGIPVLKCLCGSLSATPTSSSNPTSSATAACFLDTLAMPICGTEIDELLPGHIPPVPPKPPVFELLKVPIPELQP